MLCGGYIISRQEAVLAAVALKRVLVRVKNKKFCGLSAELLLIKHKYF
jgi:hypothetical protein